MVEDIVSNPWFDAMLQGKQRRPNAPLVVASDSRPAVATLSEVIESGRRFGSELTRIGIQPGDVVAAILPPWREWLVTCVGAAQAGAVFLPVVTAYRSHELKFILRQARARVLVAPRSYRGVDYANLVDACGDLPDLKWRFTVSGQLAPTGWRDFEDTEHATLSFVAATRGAEDMAVLVYTSGTTADPKGVMHSGRGLLAEIKAQRVASGDITDEVALSPWPPGHVAGALQFWRFLIEGVSLVAMDPWNAAIAAHLIERHRVTSSSGTPFHMTGILEAARRDGRDLSSLQNYVLGAAPVPAALVTECLARGVAVFHCYGSTEHPSVTMGAPEDSLERRLSTEGRVMAGSAIRIIGEDESEVAVGSEGEIVTRGPELFMGYLDSGLNEAAFLPGGWYRTGDIGRLDADGFLTITDRKKDIIIRGGENIASREVEDVMLRHPAVSAVAAVGAPDIRMGELVKVYVELHSGTTLSLDEVRDHFMKQHTARHKTPELLEVVISLPRNATGKVMKHELRARARSLPMVDP